MYSQHMSALVPDLAKMLENLCQQSNREPIMAGFVREDR